VARSRLLLHERFVDLEGVLDAYFQPRLNTEMEYPCIVYTRDDSWVSRADNIMYLHKKRYTVTVIDRDPDSLIPDLVEGMPHTRFDRFFVSGGLNHTVFSLYF
jgi:hypothetical protein